MPHGSTKTLLVQLRHVKKVTGKTPSQLEDYENSSIPTSLKYVYTLWLDFYNGETFSYTEFMAWQQYTGIQLNYRERELIRQISLERQSYEYKRQQAEIEIARQKAAATKGKR